MIAGKLNASIECNPLLGPQFFETALKLAEGVAETLCECAAQHVDPAAGRVTQHQAHRLGRKIAGALRQREAGNHDGNDGSNQLLVCVHAIPPRR